MDSREKDRLQQQRERVKKARDAEKKALGESKRVRVIFNVMEPGNPDGTKPDLHFSFRGIKNFHLVHGRTYDLPECVVDWLESRHIPVYKQYDPAEESRGLRAEPIDAAARIVGQAPRFNLQRLVNPSGRAPDGSAPDKQRKAA
jgi:hypothetical protein